MIVSSHPQDTSWTSHGIATVPYQGPGNSALPPITMAKRQEESYSTTPYTPYPEKIDLNPLPLATTVSQQPIPQRGMSVHQQPAFGGNRNIRNLPSGPNGKRNWSHGLFDCCGDYNTCVVVSSCPPCSYGSLKRRHDYLHDGGIPDPEHGNGAFFGGNCIVHYMLGLISLQWIPQMQLRSKIRERYNIDGNCLTDCCTSFWCGPCDMTQQGRELLLEEDSFRMKVYQPQLSVTGA